MATRTSMPPAPVHPEPTGRAPRSRRHRTIGLATSLLAGALLVTIVVVAPGPDPVEAPPTLQVLPAAVGDAIPGQRIVLLVSFDDDRGVTEPATVTAATTEEFAPHLTFGSPSDLRAGEVGEVTVVIDEAVVADLPQGDEPMLGGPLRPADDAAPGREPAEPVPAPQGPEGVLVPVTVTVTRGEVEANAEVTINVSPGEDLLEPEATERLARFLTWLASERPELGLGPESQLAPTTVQPHILVVSHYLFFSEAWELGLTWHVMIAPHDWSRLYLRPRDELAPTLAFEIPSVSDPASVPVAIDPPAVVDR